MTNFLLVYAVGFFIHAAAAVRLFFQAQELARTLSNFAQAFLTCLFWPLLFVYFVFVGYAERLW